MMTDLTIGELDQLATELTSIISALRERNTVAAFREVDESFYLQKLEEINVLKQQLVSAQQQLNGVNGRIKIHVEEICLSWKKDSSYLNIDSSTSICPS